MVPTVYDVIARTSEDAPSLLRDSIARQDLSKRGDCTVEHTLVLRLISTCGAEELVLLSSFSYHKTPAQFLLLA